MNNNTELVLIESRSARTSAISNFSENRSLEILNKAKALVMAIWKGAGIATNKQLAEYFEVSEDVVRDNLRRNKEEFASDGVKTVKGEDLKVVCESVSQTGNRIRSSLTIWTPRGTLRLGMLLQDSPVAKQLRSIILDIVDSANPVSTEPLTGAETVVKMANEMLAQERRLTGAIGTIEIVGKKVDVIFLYDRDRSRRCQRTESAGQNAEKLLPQGTLWSRASVRYRGGLV